MPQGADEPLVDLLCRELLDIGTGDDWITFREVVKLVSYHVESDVSRDLDGTVESVLRRVVSEGTATLGDDDGHGFRPWPESSDEAVARAMVSWRSIRQSREIMPGDVCWLRFDVS